MVEADGEGHQKLVKLRDTIARGLLIFARMADPDAKFRLGLRAGWALPVMREAGEYGWHKTWLKHVASPADITEMEAVLEWVCWLRRQPEEGDPAVRRIIGWAGGTQMAALAWRERCCEKTISNRIDRSVAKILLKFSAVAVEVEEVDEPPFRRGDPIRGFTEKPTKAGAPDSLEPGKIWVADIGFMFHGVRYDPEGGKVLDKAGRRRRRKK